MQGTSYDADNKKIRPYWTKGVDFGIGVDRVLKGGDRAGGEEDCPRRLAILPAING